VERNGRLERGNGERAAVSLFGVEISGTLGKGEGKLATLPRMLNCTFNRLLFFLI
jgi:hypothetical protein